MTSITERRFRENTGERYMKDGLTIRCQAVSKSKLRKWREDYNDPEATPDDTWPETQCGKSAEEGHFACKYHGGETPRYKKPPRSVLDVLPADLAAKMEMVMQNPDYISRKEDILLLKVRQLQLLEELEDDVGGEEAWGMVAEGLVELRKGNEFIGQGLIEDALEMSKNQREIWEEIYKGTDVIKNLTNTQVKTAKELRLMATNEQIHNLMANIYETLMEQAKIYINDPEKREQFLRSFVGHFRQLSIPSVTGVIEQN